MVVGDTVAVEKGGDVIPKVTRVDVTKRPADSTPFALPVICPVCGESVTREEGAVAFRCVNLLTRIHESIQRARQRAGT